MKKIFFALCVIGMSSCEKDEIGIPDQPVTPPYCDCNCGIIKSLIWKAGSTSGYPGPNGSYNIIIKNNCSHYDQLFISVPVNIGDTLKIDQNICAKNLYNHYDGLNNEPYNWDYNFYQDFCW